MFSEKMVFARSYSTQPATDARGMRRSAAAAVAAVAAVVAIAAALMVPSSVKPSPRAVVGFNAPAPPAVSYPREWTGRDQGTWSGLPRGAAGLPKGDAARRAGGAPGFQREPRQQAQAGGLAVERPPAAAAVAPPPHAPPQRQPHPHAARLEAPVEQCVGDGDGSAPHPEGGVDRGRRGGAGGSRGHSRIEADRVGGGASACGPRRPLRRRGRGGDCAGRGAGAASPSRCSSPSAAPCPPATGRAGSG